MASELNSGDIAPDFRFNTPWQSELQFYREVDGKPAVLFFLRYLGCPVCQMEMARIKKDLHLFADRGANVFVVLQSEPQVIADAANPGKWAFTIICDPGADIFRLYGVLPAGFFRYLHPAGLTAAVKATFKGYRHGRFEGHETQVPAAFIIGEDKSVRFAHYGSTISDLPLPSEIAGRIQ